MRTKNHKNAVGRKFQSGSFGVEFLEYRRLLSAALTVSQTLMVFNDVENSGPSPVETLTLTNTGDAALALNGLTVVNDPTQTNQGAADFTLVNAVSAPASLAPGASFGVQVEYSATTVELDYALLDIATSDPNTPVAQIQLHGIGTAGLGGGNQPSLELILQAYDEPNFANVGENNEASAYYPEPPAAGSDEVPLQELVKAGSGPVTIDVLASFTAASTKPYTLGWYNVSDPTNSKQQLFYTPTSEAQSVYVQPQGLTSFDPGSTVFGFYNPSATVEVNGKLVTGYTQDDLNTFDTTDPRKFRFFPLENAGGTVVPNSYIMTSTEYFEPAGYDFTNIVAIVSNVQAAPSAPTGPVLSISNPDQIVGSNSLLFNRIQNPNTVVGDTVHDTNTITLENTGTGNLTVSSVTVAASTGSNGGTQYQLVNPPTFPVTLTAGQTQSIEIQFILSQLNANGHSTNETNSAGNGGGGSDYPGVLTITSNDTIAPTTTIPLEAWWQEHSENENEPSLQTIVNMMAGYGTDINPSKVSFLTESFNNSAGATYYGEEVVSPYWAMADSSAPVSVTQLDCFHTQGATSGLDYFPQGSSSSTHNILNTASDDGQSFFPLNGSGSLAAGSFSTSGSFGFEVLNPNTYSDSALNVGDDGGGHLIRFYPVRDGSGNLIPNTYIVACDYPNGTNENFDFNDCVYLVSNIRPASTVSVSAPQTTGGAAAPTAISALETAGGVSLQWVPVLDTTLIGYNVYSSLAASTGYALITPTPVTTDTYLDTTALPGETIYYRVAAVDSTGVGLAVQTSVNTSGAVSNSLQTIAINETPTGSTTAITPGTAYTIVAGGPGVTGSSDGFRYVFAPQTGNFDEAVQVSSITVAGNFSTAGIMVRDSLSTSGSNVYMSASPVNYRFKYRSSDGASEAVVVGTTAPVYPDVWLRLTRVGDVFSGYTSADGVIWTLMSTITLSSFPTTCYLGMAVASNITTATTTAQLTNFGATPVYNGPITSPESYNVVSGQTTTEPVLAEDVDPTGTISPGTFLITTPPSEGGTATFNAANGLLSFTSVAGFIGAETLVYTVADSNGVTSSPTTVTFNVVASLPVAVADSFHATSGKSTLLNVLANDTDTNSTLDPSTVAIFSQPTSGATVSVDPVTGVITYQAPSDFTGTDTFSYTVADVAGFTSDAATVTVTVSAASTGGLKTKPLSTTALAGVPTIINVLSADTDSSATILPGTVVIVSLPSAGGTAVVNSNGTITYTAASNFAGTETFQYVVNDSAGYTSAATMVTVTVSNPSLAPIATNTTTTGTANGSVAVNITSEVDSTVGLDLTTLVITTGPSHGTYSIDTTTGVITYIPASNFVGHDSFAYTVADINGHASNVGKVDVNVGVTIGNAAGNDRSLTFTAAGGALTTVSLNRGSVVVLFTNNGTLSVRKGVATVTGGSLQISALQLSNTTAASTLSVSSKRNQGFDIEGITDNSPIRTITAPAATLSGTVTLAGVGILQVQKISDATITLGAGIATGLSLVVAGSVSDSTLTSGVFIKTIKVGAWTSSTTGASSITAPAIGSLAVGGSFQPSLNLSGGGIAIKSASIKGALGSDVWAVTGSIGAIAAGSVGSNLNATVSGSINSFTIRGGGLGATLTAASLNVLNVAGGFSGSITAGSARIVHIVGNIATGATLDFTGGGLSLSALSVAGSISGASITTAGSIGSIAAFLFSDDTILIGAATGTTLANVTASTIGGAGLNSLRLTARGVVSFSDTTLIVHTLTSAALGIVDTANPNGIALAAVTRAITGSENGSPFRYTAANTASALFGNFEIELV